MVNLERLVNFTVLLAILYSLLCVVHVVFSLISIRKAITNLTEGELKKFMVALFVAIANGFLFVLWNVFVAFGIISIEGNLFGIILTNILLISTLLNMTYLAFLAKDIGKVFGFKDIGKRIDSKLKFDKD